MMRLRRTQTNELQIVVLESYSNARKAILKGCFFY